MAKHLAVTTAALLVLSMAVAPGSYADAFRTGGDRLVELQQGDGGWDWPLYDGNYDNASPVNTIGPIGMGLAQAYLNTGDADQLAALQNAGALLLTKLYNFSPSDGYLAAQLDSIFDVTTYTDHVKTNFYDQLAAGTYYRNGGTTAYSTASYVQLIRDARAGLGNMAAWDIGMGLYAAQAVGADTTAWIAGTMAELNEMDSSAYYDVIGLAGGILGLASAGQAFDPTAGDLAGAGSVGDLADILASYQIAGGGFAWNSNYVIENDGNETIQETAYAILALNEYDSVTYLANILGAGSYIESVQLGTGGWENYVGSGENNEITGEALWALSVVPVPEPASMALLGIGLAGLAVTRARKKRNS